jgi:hypothetical protein
VWFLVIGVFAMSQGPVAKVLTLRLGVFLGEISFALYLCHAVLIHYLEGYRAQLQSAGATGYLLFWVACILLATLLFLGVETPWRRYILSRIGNKAPQAPFLPFFKATEWVSVLGLLLVSGTALYCLKYSTIVPLQPEEVANFMAQTTTQRVHLAQRVTIDGRYELLSMQMDNGGVDRGEVHVRFLLRANQVLHASDLFAVHLNQPDGTMKANFDRRLDFGRVTIPAGTTWIHKTSFPIALLKGADNLGVAMYAHPSSLFGITGGNTDWGGKRLIVPFTYDAAP